MSVPVALDLLVAGLLVATIAYAIILNRRLSQLRGGAEQMARLVSDFYQATARAESGVSALKEVAGRNDSEILEQLQSMQKLRDELEYLVERAEGHAAASAPDAGLDAELFADPDIRSASVQELR
jgi:hypothetical protein